MSSHPPRDTLNTRISTSRDGTRIYADAIGDSTKPAIVFVHGFSFCTLVFDKLFLETKLSREFFLVRYDMRGHGRSGKPISQECFTSKSFAEDFVAVCESFKLVRPFFAGWSLGASVLTDIATHLPSDFLSGAIFLGSLPCTGQTVQDVAHPEAISGVTELLSADTPDRMLKSREAFLDSCLADPSLITFETRCTWLGIMGFSLPIGAGGTLGREQDLNRLFELGSGVSSEETKGDSFSSSYRGQEKSGSNQSKRRGFPFLVLHGDRDSVINGELLVKLISPRFKHLEVHMLKGCGHTIQYERAEEVAKLIASFANRVLRQRREEVTTRTTVTRLIYSTLFPQFIRDCLSRS